MNKQALLKQVEAKYQKENLPRVEVGDTIRVYTRIVEGNKKRLQQFTGTVIARRGSGTDERITVRRIVANEGVERVIPVHSPSIAKIETVRHGDARRSKLFYLRERVGKARRLRDRRRRLKHLEEERPGSTTDKEKLA